MSTIFESAYVSHFGRSIEESLADCPGEVTFTTYRDLLLFALWSLKSGLGYGMLGFLVGLAPVNLVFYNPFTPSGLGCGW